MLTIPLRCFLNDKNIFHINFTRSLAFQWKLLVMAKHCERFASKILVCVQPLITRLCPLHVHKHGFIEHNRFISINRWSVVHYDISFNTTNFTATIYRLLCEILLQRSLTRTISRRDIAKIVRISRWFIVSIRCFADILAINRERSEQTLVFAIIICITFAQYCRLRLRTDKLPVLTSIFLSVLH